MFLSHSVNGWFNMQHHWQQFLAKYDVIEMRTKSGRLSPVWRWVTTCSSSLEVRQDHLKAAQCSLINLLLLKAKMDLFLHNLILTNYLIQRFIRRFYVLHNFECAWIHRVQPNPWQSYNCNIQNPCTSPVACLLKAPPSFSCLPSTFQLSNPLDRRPMALSTIQDEK